MCIYNFYKKSNIKTILLDTDEILNVPEHPERKENKMCCEITYLMSIIYLINNYDKKPTRGDYILFNSINEWDYFKNLLLKTFSNMVNDMVDKIKEFIPVIKSDGKVNVQVVYMN